MRLRPCIDIHNGKVKQIVGSSLTDNGTPEENFISEKGADYFAGLYKSHNLPGGHIIILNKYGTEEYEASKEEACKAFKAYPGGLQIGGGITDENASDFISLGASHVIVTSFIFENQELSFERMKRLNDAVSKKNVVFDLSCKKIGDRYFVTTNRWQTVTKTVVDCELLERLGSFCDEYLIHAVDVEGKQNGPETDLIKELSDYSGNALTYAGGIHSFDDIKTIRNASKGRMDYTIGSALDIFGGNLEFSIVADKYSDR